MKRCVVVTVDVRDSEEDEEAGGLLVGYPENSSRYTVVVQPQVGESQPMLMERCAEAARGLAGQLQPKPVEPVEKKASFVERLARMKLSKTPT